MPDHNRCNVVFRMQCSNVLKETFMKSMYPYPIFRSSFGPNLPRWYRAHCLYTAPVDTTAMAPIPTEDYSAVESMMKNIRKAGGRPPPPPLEGSVGTAYLDVELSAAEVAAEVEADDVLAVGVNIFSPMALDRLDGTGASVVNGPLASAPDIAIAAAGAETQEEKPAEKQEEQDKNQVEKQEEQEDEAIACIKCLRDVDMKFIDSYQVMSSCNRASGSARKVKVKCNLCNAKES